MNFASIPAFLFGCAMSTSALAGAQAGKSFRMDFKVLHGGEEIASPVIVVAEGKEADILIDNPKAHSPKLRMLVNAEAAASNQKDLIMVKIIFFESVAGSWVVVSEPVVGVAPAAEAALVVGGASKGDASNYEIRVAASPFDTATMSLGEGFKSSSATCPAGEASLAFAPGSLFGISAAHAGS